MTVSTAPIVRSTTSSQPGFLALVQSEWTKLRSVRSTWIILGLTIGLSVGFAAILALVSGLTHDSWNDTIRNQFDPILTTLGGWLFGMILLITLAVNSVTSEYGSRMMRTTFIVTPNRNRVFAAKATVLALVGLGTTLIAILGMILVAQPFFRHYGLESASFTDPDVTRYLVIAVILQGLICTLIPFSFAWLLRGTASAITTSLGFAVLPWMLTPLVPLWVKTNVFRYLPDNAKDRLLGVLKPDAATYLGETTAWIVVALWIVGLLAVAAITLNRRDV
jgi:ABC-type transport system involved in multi-copper enzyme maturation permease subunit